jgi:hypothetical protein
LPGSFTGVVIAERVGAGDGDDGDIEDSDARFFGRLAKGNRPRLNMRQCTFQEEKSREGSGEGGLVFDERVNRV